jgi:predicted transcriptional regulator
MRDFQAIIAGILNCSLEKQGITKTRLSNEMQLSFTQIKDYLQYLQQYELISYDEERSVFRTTTRGKRFLKLYNEMTELAPRRNNHNILGRRKHWMG